MSLTPETHRIEGSMNSFALSLPLAICKKRILLLQCTSYHLKCWSSVGNIARESPSSQASIKSNNCDVKKSRYLIEKFNLIQQLVFICPFESVRTFVCFCNAWIHLLSFWINIIKTYVLSCKNGPLPDPAFIEIDLIQIGKQLLNHIIYIIAQSSGWWKMTGFFDLSVTITSRGWEGMSQMQGLADLDLNHHAQLLGECLSEDVRVWKGERVVSFGSRLLCL